MEHRETRKIILSNNTEIEIFTYITGGEKRKITEILVGNLSANTKGETTGEIPVSLVYKANDEALKMLVVSVGGSKENVINLINSLRAKDYDHLLMEINKISNDTDFVEKKTI